MGQSDLEDASGWRTRWQHFACATLRRESRRPRHIGTYVNALGDLPALLGDPLPFLTERASLNERVVPLRLPFMPTFLLLDSADIERVLVTDHRNFVKPIWLRTRAVRRLLGDGLVTSDGEDWKRQRKECGPAFQPGSIPGYAQTFIRLTARMLDDWEPGQSRDIQRDMARLTLEIVAETMLGADIRNDAPEISEAMDAVMKCFAAPGRRFGLLPLPPSRTEIKALRTVDRLVDRLIENAAGDEGTPAGRQRLLALLGDGKNTRKQRREQVKTFLAAGHESSALALTWIFLLLDGKPEADRCLARELNTVLGGRLPRYDDLPSLPFTQAVVKEALRLYPPVWITGRKAIARCEIAGHAVPTGSLILTSQWAVHRSTRYFPDPETFRPERWLTEPTDLPRFAYFPFGGGPRVCIGQNFAFVESVLLLASIAQRYRLSLDTPQAIDPWATMTLRPPTGIMMRLGERDLSPARSSPPLPH